MRIDDDVIQVIINSALSLKDHNVCGRIRAIKYEFQETEPHERISLWTLSQVNRAFRRAAQATLWFEVKMTKFDEIDDIVNLLDINPQAAEYIRFLNFDLVWNTRITLVDREDAEPSWWKRFCLDFLDWAYADRENILQEYEAIKSKELGEEFRDYFRPSSGPMGGEEPDPVSDRHRDPAASMKTIEELITKVSSMTAFHYRSMLLPLTRRSCEHLRDCRSLEIIMMGTQGEMSTLKYPMTPLEVVFTNRQSFLKVVALSLQLSPSSINAVQDCDLEAFEGDKRHHSVLDKVEAEPGDEDLFSKPGSSPRWAAIPNAVFLPNLDKYLESNSTDGVPYMDRPIVEVIRSLISAQDQIGLLVLSPTCRWLCRMPQIIWLWLKVQVSNRYSAGETRDPPVYFWDDEPWIQAARALRPACLALAQRLQRPDHKLSTSDVPLLLDFSSKLEVYRPHLSAHPLQTRLVETWNQIVTTGHTWQQRDLRPVEPGTTLLHLIRPDLRADFLIGNFPPFLEEKAQSLDHL